MNTWAILGLLAFAAGVTLATDWLAARLWPPGGRRGRLAAILAGSIWMLLIFAAGLIAARYIERASSAALGYLALGLVALGLSLFRAWLYRRTGEQRPVDWRSRVQPALYHATCLLGACAACLALSLLVPGPADPRLLVPACVGALLPGLARPLEARLGRPGVWRSLGAAACVALLTAFFIPFIGWQAWGLIPIGFVSRLLLDLLNPEGIRLLWPLRHTRYRIGHRPASHHLALGLAALVVALAFAAGGLRQPSPPAAPPPSLDDALGQYPSLRGYSLVFADVEGAWQATGRRVSARFEVLNSAGRAFILLDRYSGQVFTAGRAAADHLYLNRIILLTGAEARIKPVEVQLHDQRLADALPAVYQMQREPGLQHIFVSGDVVLPAGEDGVLPADYAQTRQRKIQCGEEGHYHLSYLTASELIALAEAQVALADLVIVATYAGPEDGPTATPLPSPPPTPEPAP